MGGQSISVEKLGLKFNHSENSKIRFTIMDVYPGTKFKDVAISELFSNGCCISGQSKIILSTEKIKKIQDINIYDSIKLIDSNDKIVYGFKTELGTLIHDRILKIITENGNSIVVTPNHFVFSGSNNEKIQARQLTLHDSLLIKRDEHEIVLDKIAKVITIEKPTETFYFKKMEFGNQQIAWPVRAIFNNIITDDEYLDKINKLKKGIDKSASNSVQAP
jgi:intein/homing endonuclease